MTESPYRTIAPHPLSQERGWYVQAHVGFGTHWVVYGPYRWRWWARWVAWCTGGQDYVTCLVGRWSDNRAHGGECVVIETSPPLRPASGETHGTKGDGFT